jgi:hypothetical protein
MMYFIRLFASACIVVGVTASIQIPAIEEIAKEAVIKYTQSHTPAIGVSAIKQSTADAAVSDPPYWLAQVQHQGRAAFNTNPNNYKVFRNVKDYGAIGTILGYTSHHNIPS